MSGEKQAIPEEFVRDLAALLNKYSMENGSNTPDFILAHTVWRFIVVLNGAIAWRDEWYGIMPHPAFAGDDGETE